MLIGVLITKMWFKLKMISVRKMGSVPFLTVN